MTEKRTFIMPMPPSINRTYKSGNGRFYKDHKAAKWQADAIWKIKSQAITALPEGRYCVRVVLYGLRSNADIDGRIKGILDAIQLAGVITDDKLIDDLNIQRGPKDSDPHAYVVISLI